MPEQLWFTEFLNHYFGGGATFLLRHLGIEPAYPAAPITNTVAMEILVVSLLIAFFLAVRATLSVESPGRLQHIVDVPKGKIVYHLSNTNYERAYDVLHDTTALMGNVPNIMLLSGTPDDVRTYCKKMIDTVGKDGGFIMDSAVMLDEAKPENLKAMFDFTREYSAHG